MQRQAGDLGRSVPAGDFDGADGDRGAKRTSVGIDCGERACGCAALSESASFGQQPDGSHHGSRRPTRGRGRQRGAWLSCVEDRERGAWSDCEYPAGSSESAHAIPWAEAWVDGERVGETPIGSVQVSIGPHEVVFRHPELGERRVITTVTLAGPAKVSVDMRKK